VNDHCTKFCRATALRVRRCRHRQDHLPGKGVLTIRMLQVSDEFVPELEAFVGATGTAHEPQAREQRRLILRRLPDRPGTSPNAVSPADNECDETGQHKDDKRLIALEQIFVCHSVRIAVFAAAQRNLILELNASKSTGPAMPIGPLALDVDTCEARANEGGHCGETVERSRCVHE
jgi:hypothetical protein